MLNYLGANPQPGLSMPAGMPGSGAPSDPLASPMGGGGAPAGPAPMPAFGGMGMPGVGMMDAAGKQYEAVTQEDGTVLLHMKNPDGSRGPAVKIVQVGSKGVKPSGM